MRESERHREESKRALAEVVARLQDLEEAAQAESRFLAQGISLPEMHPETCDRRESPEA